MIKKLGIISLGLFFTMALASSTTVVFNSKTLKYHRESCRWAERCTRNCTTISLEKAIKYGGIPCKVCKPPRK